MKQLLAGNFVACALAVSGVLTADFVSPGLNSALAQTRSGANSLVDATMPYFVISTKQPYATCGD